MPLYDFACTRCGARFEDMAPVDEPTHCCPACGHPAKRLLSIGQAFRADAPWIESVTAVAEKGSDKAHVAAFLAAPNRATYQRWLRGEGIRPQEPGECRRHAPDTSPLRREVVERFRARRGLA